MEKDKYILNTIYLRIIKINFIALGITYYIHKHKVNCLYIHLFKVKIIIGKNHYE
jgi:hypothetical protein